MPVEIRELIIKTEVKTVQHRYTNRIQDKDLSKLKEELFEACKRLLDDNKKTNYNR